MLHLRLNKSIRVIIIVCVSVSVCVRVRASMCACVHISSDKRLTGLQIKFHQWDVLELIESRTLLQVPEH